MKNEGLRILQSLVIPEIELSCLIALTDVINLYGVLRQQLNESIPVRAKWFEHWCHNLKAGRFGTRVTQ